MRILKENIPRRVHNTPLHPQLIRAILKEPTPVPKTPILPQPLLINGATPKYFMLQLILLIL